MQCGDLKSPRQTITFLLIVGASLPMFVGSPESRGGENDLPIEPAARQLLERWANSIAVQTDLKVTIASELTVSGEGFRHVLTLQYDVLLKRPKHFALRSSKPRDGIDIVVDGKQLFKAAHRERTYSLSAAPAALRDVFPSGHDEQAFDALSEWLLPSICSREVGKRAFSAITDLHDLGAVTIDERECRRLRAVGPRGEWSIVIEDGNPPIMRKVVLAAT